MAESCVIVGAGPAGIAAANAIRERIPNASIAVVGDEPHPFYSRPGLAYLLTGEVSERQLLLKHANGFETVKGSVASVDVGGRRVTTGNGKSLDWDRLLLATGSAAARVTTPGADLQGVVQFNNLEDARTIIKLAKRGKSAVVVGGGITALEIVEGLVARGVETHYLQRSDRYWPNVLDAVESGIVERRLREHGVDIRHKSQISQICGKDGKVAEVLTDSDERIKCQIVAIAVGVQPRTELARAASIKVDRGIVTNEFLETSVAGVYAAGDAAQITDPSTGKGILEALWGKALAQGRTAGANMAGDRAAYNRGAAFNVTRLAGITTTIIGAVGQGDDDDLHSITRGDSESWRQLPNVLAVQADSEVNRVRITLGKDRFLGAIVMGDQTLSEPLRQIVERKIDVSPVLPRLSLPGIVLHDAIIDFWTMVGQR